MRKLLSEHLVHMADISQEGSMHALDVDGLTTRDVTMWAAWDGECTARLRGVEGARRAPGRDQVDAYPRRLPGRGVATRILEGIITEARRRGYDTLLLETGSWADFEPARRLYERHGFEYCGPFGDYPDEPNSVFMRRAL